jgi:hypothetical protein
VLTWVDVVPEYFSQELTSPSFVIFADGGVPTVNHIELSTYLISNSLRYPMRVKDFKVLPWIQFPIRVFGIPVQIQNSSEVVIEDHIDIKATGDTADSMMVSTQYQ